MTALRSYLLEHPALVYWLGFPRVADPSAPHGFALIAQATRHNPVEREQAKFALMHRLYESGYSKSHSSPPHRCAFAGATIGRGAPQLHYEVDRYTYP